MSEQKELKYWHGLVVGALTTALLIAIALQFIQSQNSSKLNTDACPAFMDMWHAREPYLEKTINSLQSENYRLRDICVENLLNGSCLSYEVKP